MKKILFFETKEFTGATRVTRTLAKAAKKKYQVAFAQVGDKVREDIESAMSAEKPDILFSSFVKINSDVITSARDKGIDVIVRNDYRLSDVSETTKTRIKETYPFADEIIVQTEEMRQELCQNLVIDASKVRVMDNPLDEEDICEKSKVPNPFPDNGKFHFLWVGRRVQIKDLPTLQKAFEIVNKRNPDTDLTLISDDPNPYRWMKHAGCLVISSISEASPNVLREALFLGTPVISTDCCQTVRQLLSPHMIAPVGDYSTLAEVMANMLKKN